MKTISISARFAVFILLLLSPLLSQARTKKAPKPQISQELLIKVANESPLQQLKMPFTPLGRNWFVLRNTRHLSWAEIQNQDGVIFLQQNSAIQLAENYKLQDSLRRAALTKLIKRNAHLLEVEEASPHDAELQITFPPQTYSQGHEKLKVALLGTGIDLADNNVRNHIAINHKEIADNGIDDDNNGLIDDINGWDFVENSNLPMEKTLRPEEILTLGGNPGQGTHAARKLLTDKTHSQTELLPIRILNAQGVGKLSDLLHGTFYALENNARIIHVQASLEDSLRRTPALQELLTIAEEAGSKFVYPDIILETEETCPAADDKNLIATLKKISEEDGRSLAIDFLGYKVEFSKIQSALTTYTQALISTWSRNTKASQETVRNKTANDLKKLRCVVATEMNGSELYKN